jgi:glycosyltransferase involved in cell wall biosynthesis
MRYWIVSELFYPDEVSTGYVMTKIAETLSETVNVGVICGPAKYQSAVFKANYTLSEKIILKRVSVPRFNKNRIITRILNSFFLTIAIGFKVVFNVKPVDKVILVTNPPTLLPFIAALKRLKNFKLVVIIHDVFPENAASGGMLRPKTILYRLLVKLFNWSYRCSDKLITVGSDMQELIFSKVAKSCPVSVITNWADHKEVFPSSNSVFFSNYPKNISDKIILQFAGNIGRVQGLDLLFRILSKVNSLEFGFVLIGDGAQKGLLMESAQYYGFKNIYFMDSRSRAEQNSFLNACNIGLVTLSPGMFGLGVPSKVYNILSAGKPLLYIGDYNSEVYRYVKLHNVGWAFSWEDEESIISFFEQLGDSFRGEILEKGSNARRLVEQCFTRDGILETYRNEILS